MAQARAQGALLDALDLSGIAVRVSPQGRAVQTAALALGHRNAMLHTDARLREIGVGAWSGVLRCDMVARSGPVGPDTPDGPLALYEHAPGGEGFTALKARCAAFLSDLSGPTIIVTHGITSRMLRCLALGQPPAALGELPGGQGVVHVVENGVHKTLA
jgi:probable phosphoglycerate mutase